MGDAEGTHLFSHFSNASGKTRAGCTLLHGHNGTMPVGVTCHLGDIGSGGLRFADPPYVLSVSRGSVSRVAQPHFHDAAEGDRSHSHCRLAFG